MSGAETGQGKLLDTGFLEPGMKFDSMSGYRLVMRLGRGGMGEVWKAERTSAAGHTQTVAVKFLTDPGAGQESLDAEALRMSRLSHDNIVPFLDSGKDDAGRFFVAMAFVEGMDLDCLRFSVGMDSARAYEGQAVARIPDQLVGFIVFMTLRALRYAHTFDFGNGVVGLIHRDVSPGNILLDIGRGFVKLSDFGVAAVQESDEVTGQIAGKVPYMAPEVLIGERVDARSDVYALGLVAYELLTGFNPNVRPVVLNSVIGAITEVMLSLDQELVPPHEVIEGVNPEISRVVVKMLEREPDRRHSSAAEALGELRHCLFDRGFGPTTGSMETYFKLLAEPKAEISEQAKQTLSFLDWSAGREAVLPPWKLTPLAAKELEETGNPCRRGS